VYHNWEGGGGRGIIGGGIIYIWIFSGQHIHCTCKSQGPITWFVLSKDQAPI